MEKGFKFLLLGPRRQKGGSFRHKVTLLHHLKKKFLLIIAIPKWSDSGKEGSPLLMIFKDWTIIPQICCRRNSFSGDIY